MALDITVNRGRNVLDLSQGAPGTVRPAAIFSTDEAYGAGQPAPQTQQPGTFSVDEAYSGAQDQSFPQWAADQAQFLGGRALTSAASVPGLPADLVSLASRLPSAATDYLPGLGPIVSAERLRQAAQPNMPTPLGSQNIRGMLADYVGQPRQPRNAAERYAGSIADMAGATAPTLGAGLVAPTLRNIAAETFAAAGSGAATEAARQAYPDNPWIQALAGMAGGVGPGVVASAARGAIRGGTGGARQAQQALQDFAAIGAKPTLAQATTGGYWPGRYMARLLEFTPGGTLPGRQRWKQQLDSAAKVIDDALTHATAGGGTSDLLAGQALQAGAQRFSGKISKTAASLEARLEKAVPGQTVVPPNATLKALNDMTAIGAGSEVGAATVSPTLKSALEQFQNDVTNSGGVTFQALKAFRTKLGAKTQSGQALIGDVSSGQASQLYKALTRDMEDAATANGAGGLVKLRNSYYASRKGQLESSFDPLNQARTEEAAFKRFEQAPASQQAEIMGQLSPAMRRVVAGRYLYKLGLPRPSEATGDLERFSFDTFDTNFEKLAQKGETAGGTARSPSSLDAIFSQSGNEGLKDALMRLSKAAERYKAAEHFLRNPSQTAVVGSQIGGAALVGSKIVNLDPVGALFSAGLVYGLPYAFLKGGNTTAFINLIAMTARQTPETLPGQITRFAAFVRQNPEYAPAVKQMLEQASGPQEAQQ